MFRYILESKKRDRKYLSKSNLTTSETPYPAMSQAEKNEMAVGSAATLQDLGREKRNHGECWREVMRQSGAALVTKVSEENHVMCARARKRQ